MKKQALVLLIMGLFTAGIHAATEIKSNNEDKVKATEGDDKELKMKKFFCDYEYAADVYLSRPVFNGTPITGEMLASCAIITYEETGVIVPLALALSQAQWESGMGKRGRSARTNPYNIGEHDNGVTTKRYSTTREGVQAYYDLMARDYLNGKTVAELMNNFVSIRGYRYASSRNYETNIKKQKKYIARWVSNNAEDDIESNIF